MTLATTSLFNRIHQYMGWLGARQKIIAQNLSHVDTPHYHAHDLVPFRQLVRGGKLKATSTHPHHIHHAKSGVMDFPVIKDSAADVRLSENAVSLEQELMKASEVSHAHALMANQYKKTTNLFRLALGRHGAGG